MKARLRWLEIIDHFEENGLASESAYPTTPRQLAVAHVLELYGSEGLLRPAMHYRWSFPEVNDAFTESNFADGLRPGAPEEEALEAARNGMERMRLAAVAFGVSPETIPLIESAYLVLLELLQAHLGTAPYLLGGRPSLADYGLIAPLYGHLSRDPQGEVEEGAILERGLGLCRFEFRGATINALAQPYRIFLLQRLQDACDAMPAGDRRSVDELLAEVGLSALLQIRTQRRVERARHREVLGTRVA